MKVFCTYLDECMEDPIWFYAGGIDHKLRARCLQHPLCASDMELWECEEIDRKEYEALLDILQIMKS